MRRSAPLHRRARFLRISVAGYTQDPGPRAACERRVRALPRQRAEGVPGSCPVLGEQHLHEVLVEYCRYFNDARPHQGIDQLVPGGSLPSAEGNGPVVATAYLNGLHHSYRRAA
jgi:putative transposase